MDPVQEEIVVRGTSEAQAMPDRATVRVSVETEAGGRDDAYADAARIADRVDAVVAARGDAVRRAVVAALVVTPRTRWDNGQDVRIGWQASRTQVLEVVDLGVLGELMAELTAAGAAVVGPSWVLDVDNPIRSEARQLAALDARRRADAYASALSLTITGIAWVAEPGLRLGAGGAGGGGRWDVMSAPMTMASARMEEADVIDVSPAELTVAAEVEVGFRFAPAGSR